MRLRFRTCATAARINTTATIPPVTLRTATKVGLIFESGGVEDLAMFPGFLKRRLVVVERERVFLRFSPARLLDQSKEGGAPTGSRKVFDAFVVPPRHEIAEFVRVAFGKFEVTVGIDFEARVANDKRR